jgi:hypothetical protein
MKFTHAKCGGIIKDRMKTVGAGRVFQGFYCDLCGKEFDEGNINDLYLHGHMTPASDGGSMDAVLMQGFAMLKKVREEPIRPKRVRYPKKTAAYRKRQRSEDR